MNDPKAFLEAVAALTAEYKKAFDQGDLAKAEQISALMRSLSHQGPASEEMEKVGQGERLILAERWAEARDVLATVDRAKLPEMSRPGVLNNLAYTTAQAGDPARAIELILTALKEAEATPDYPPEKLPFMRSTHAIALSLAGKHEEAIAILEPIVAALENPVRARTTRAYYLGQSYRALGRDADAVRVFELASKGEGAFAKRAAEVLTKR